ncbi:MAG: adenosylhomocysteinase [Bacillota bacterium]
MSIIRDAALAPEGKRKIEWVRSYMPILSSLERELAQSQPLKGLNVSVSVHLEAKTAYLCQVLHASGANVFATGSNPFSTQDDIAAALAQAGVEVFAWYGATPEEYEAHLIEALSCAPHLIIDDGGDFVHLLHGKRADLARNVMGGCEETTTGVHRLRAREREGALAFPMVAVNDAHCKYLFDNRYGTGQSVWDGIMRTTNLTIAGKVVVVAGYGWCGRGVSARARGLGARVIVTEVDPVRAIEAVMDGFEVCSMDDAAPLGDIFVTVTGCRDAITGRHFERMKDGVLLANAGHFDVEVNKPDLEQRSSKIQERRRNVRGYTMKDGRVLNLLADGRLVNLASGDGHPAEIMDMSFALQILSALYVFENAGKLENRVYKVPASVDARVAHMKLNALGIRIDALTQRQRDYLLSSEGE